MATAVFVEMLKQLQQMTCLKPKSQPDALGTGWGTYEQESTYGLMSQHFHVLNSPLVGSHFLYTIPLFLEEKH
jgi:hypothetical protein